MSANQGASSDFDVWEFCAADISASNQVSRHTTIEIDIKEHAQSLQAFSAVRAMYCEVENRNHGFSKHAELESLLSGAESAQTGFAFTIDQTMARDISRETALFGVRLEKIARQFLACMKHHGIDCIVLKNAEWLDQGTIRLISRLGYVAGNSAIRIQLLFQKSSETKTRKMSALTFSRFMLWKRMQMNQSKLTSSIPRCNLQLKLIEYQSEKEFRTCVANAINDASYDLALYFCLCAENQFSDDELARALMIKSTIECIIGRTTQSLELAEQSLETAKSLSLQSRAHYLIGLINAKRVGNHVVASKHFNQGRDLMLETSEGVDDYEEMMIEASWHENGLALLEAVRQEPKTLSEKEHHFNKAMLYAKYALSRTLKLSTPKADFLKFNLVANILSLHEMQGEYKQALTLFENEFVPLAKKCATNTTHLKMGLTYRVGLLEFKSGDCKAALRSFECSYEHAISGENRYAVARILFALANVYYDIDQFTDAKEKIAKLHVHVLETHDVTMAKALVTKLQSWQTTSPSFSFATYVESLCIKFGLSQDGCRSAVSKPSLDPQLPSYNPLVDLLPSPDEDLNRILASLFKSNQAFDQGKAKVAEMV